MVFTACVRRNRRALSLHPPSNTPGDGKTGRGSRLRRRVMSPVTYFSNPLLQSMPAGGIRGVPSASRNRRNRSGTLPCSTTDIVDRGDRSPGSYMLNSGCRECSSCRRSDRTVWRFAGCCARMICTSARYVNLMLLQRQVANDVRHLHASIHMSRNGAGRYAYLPTFSCQECVQPSSSTKIPLQTLAVPGTGCTPVRRPPWTRFLVHPMVSCRR